MPRSAIAQRVQPWFGVAKVGFELYAEAGPVAFDALQDKGFRVFADLKLHDIPTTVGRAARVLGRRGVDVLNFHAAGEPTCCAPESKDSRPVRARVVTRHPSRWR